MNSPPVIEIYPGATERMAMSGGEVDEYCLKKALEVVESAKVLAPVGPTHQLSTDIRAMREGLFWTVEAYAPYALFVHGGTRPHTIEPKSGKVLKFPTTGGSVVYTKKVNHPGTQGHPFLTEALAAVVTA